MGDIIILSEQEYKEQPVPEVGKKYHIFDDGKIRPSRHSITTIAEVIPFADFKDEEILEAWHEEVEDNYWLFAQETDYFIRGTFEKDDDQYFVRTVDGGWFSLGWFGSRLDIDGVRYIVR